MRLVTLALFSLATLSAIAAPVDDFRGASEVVWGIGDNLPAPYTKVDMNVETRIFFGFIPITYNQTAGVDEYVAPKTAGSINFSVNTSNLNNLLPPLIVNLSGAQTGSNVLWTQSQTFSQTGGWRIQGTFDLGGTMVPVDITINNVLITSRLRADFQNVPSFLNNTLMGWSNVQGTYLGGDADNRIDMSTTTITGTISGLTPSRIEIRLRNIQHVMTVPYPTSVVQGQVDLQDVADPGQVVSYTLQRVNGVESQSGQVTLTQSGFSVNANLPRDLYRLIIKGATHLQRVIELELSSTPATFTTSLTNGDVDGNNEVGPADFAVLSQAFGSELGGAGYVRGADLDQNDEVGPSDFAILSNNFGQEGETP